MIETGDAIAKRLICLSNEKAHHINQGDLQILILHTGNININMVQTVLENKNIEIRKCEI